MTYFDNSATTFYKPPEVIGAIVNTLKYLSANPGRSGHSMATKAGLLVHQARTNLAALVGCRNDSNLIFTSNCTAALNFAILGTLTKGGNVVTTACEHNSVLRPLFELERNGLITITVLQPDVSGQVSLEQIKSAVRDETYLIATNHISNVTGAKTDVKSIGKFARENNLLYLVDGAQSVGHESISMDEYFIDMLSIAPHKGLHAAQGVGALALSERVRILPTLFGGTGTSSESLLQPLDLPESLESGTLPTPAIAGLNAAVLWHKKTGEAYNKKVESLCEYAVESLRKMKKITVYNPPSSYNGIAAFNIENLTSVEVSGILSDEYDICVRGGLHCAPLIHKHLGTLQNGIVRASFACDNTFAEVEFFLQAVKEISSGK